MCTVTIIPLAASGRRIVMNRDERRSRPVATPPAVRHTGEREALMPRDASSGGTWLAVNDAGLVFILINRNPDLSERWQAKAAEQISRGLIVPRIAPAGSPAEAEALVNALDPARYALFRLLIDDGETVREWTSDGSTLAHQDHTTGKPLLFTSSGLGDHLVEGPRRELFNTRLLAQPPQDWERAQRAFHAHHWPDRRHLSVDMARADACTVSMTEVDVRPDRATMRYRGLDGVEHTSELPLRVSAV